MLSDFLPHVYKGQVETQSIQIKAYQCLQHTSAALLLKLYVPQASPYWKISFWVWKSEPSPRGPTDYKNNMFAIPSVQARVSATAESQHPRLQRWHMESWQGNEGEGAVGLQCQKLEKRGEKIIGDSSQRW